VGLAKRADKLFLAYSVRLLQCSGCKAHKQSAHAVVGQRPKALVIRSPIVAALFAVMSV